MRWFVKVDGKDDELKELSQILENSDIEIIKEENAYFISSHRWDSLTNCKDVRNRVKNIIADINGIAKLLLDLHQPIRSDLDQIVKIDNEGNKKSALNRKCAQLYVRHKIPRIFKDSEKEVELDPGLFFTKYLALTDDEHVQYVIQMVDFGFDTWYSLYCILETIEHDMGGPKKVKWINNEERNRFEGTVHDRRLIGLRARHGFYKKIEKNDPMNNPMTLSEAQIFIWKTIIRWLMEKNL
jgi:hypothetical protein